MSTTIFSAYCLSQSWSSWSGWAFWACSWSCVEISFVRQPCWLLAPISTTSSRTKRPAVTCWSPVGSTPSLDTPHMWAGSTGAQEHRWDTGLLYTWILLYLQHLHTLLHHFIPSVVTGKGAHMGEGRSAPGWVASSSQSPIWQPVFVDSVPFSRVPQQCSEGALRPSPAYQNTCHVLSAQGLEPRTLRNYPVQQRCTAFLTVWNKWARLHEPIPSPPGWNKTTSCPILPAIVMQVQVTSLKWYSFDTALLGCIWHFCVLLLKNLLLFFTTFDNCR